MILLYTGCVIYCDPIPLTSSINISYPLHVAYRILNEENLIKNVDNLDYTEYLLQNFIIDVPKVYAEYLLSFICFAYVLIYLHVVEYLCETIIKKH